MSTVANSLNAAISEAEQGLADLAEACHGHARLPKVTAGANLFTSLAHLGFYVGDMTKDTPLGEKGKTSTGNNFEPGIERSFFDPAPLFLTKGILHEARITERGERFLAHLAEEPTMVNWKENTVSKKIIGPACSIFVDAFSLGRKLGNQVRWSVEVDDKREHGGDIDIKFNLTVEQEGKKTTKPKATAEMKTPKAIGDGVAEQLTNPEPSCAITVYRLMGHAKDVWTVRDAGVVYVQSALAWPPGNLFPLGFDGHTLNIGKDLIRSKKKFPEVVICSKTWTRFFSVLGSWIFAVLISVDKDLRNTWHELCPEQVEQAERFIMSGKAPSSNPCWSALTRSGAAVLHAIQQSGLRVVSMMIHPSRFRTLKIEHYDTLIVNRSDYYRLPFGSTLPDPSRTHSSSTALSLIYTLPNIVVKVFNDINCYARECIAYDKLKHLQGYGVPVLYASGRCAGDGAPFLVISNEGESLDELTESERAALEPLVKQIHTAQIHHHDLHLRNVVRGKGGQLRIIDFGESVFDCGLGGCEDEWKEDWES
ncbi:hypothetical protein NMY22_g2926 [Coprinellus aureogranulatus]|nr:hypothetical protein NMY22_g2926 [Coprinellus aureogranulatus]